MACTFAEGPHTSTNGPCHCVLSISFYPCPNMQYWRDRNIFAPPNGLHIYRKVACVYKWSLPLHIDNVILFISQYARLAKTWGYSDRNIFAPQSGLHNHSGTTCLCKWPLPLHTGNMTLSIPQYATLARIWGCGDRSIFEDQNGMHIRRKVARLCK